MAWAMLVLVFCKVDVDQNGYHIGPIVHALLINIYLAKFFYWETGYFHTLDITMDRAGYYLCWGCLCWVQVSKNTLQILDLTFFICFLRPVSLQGCPQILD